MLPSRCSINHIPNKRHLRQCEQPLPIAFVKADPFTGVIIPQADQCALSFCVKTYDESIKNGNSIDLARTLLRIRHKYLLTNGHRRKRNKYQITVDTGTTKGVTVRIDATQQTSSSTPSSDIIEALNQTTDLY